MEIGSFIELDLRSTGEYYNGDDVARLNTARAGIYHCLKILHTNTIYLPFYECFTVRDFLQRKGVRIIYYKISENFEPQIGNIEKSAAVLFVNYFGVMGSKRMKYLVSSYNNVIIDNAQSFYSKPIKNCLNVYSARKFFGVPDGCYVIGPNARLFEDEYEQDFSSSTANFLLESIEVGCTKAYSDRMKNEERIDSSEIKRMSKLTLTLLKNEPYNAIKNKRINNFLYAHTLLRKFNVIDPAKYLDKSCVPMVYPLVIKRDRIVEELIKNKIYTGRWWKYLVNETDSCSFEYMLSSYMVPISIDQRYDSGTIDYIYSIIKKLNDE
jgi:hypothetical protein